jgi:hypothetical protein
MEIEALVLDGVRMDSTQGRRLRQLTEAALTRLLEQRGAGGQLEDGAMDDEESDGKVTGEMRLPANTNEARWAEEIALAVYRAMDRTF